MSKTHTHGPWSVWEDDHQLQIRDERHILLATVRPSRAHAEANAQLIARSPELLVRLCNLVDQAVPCEGDRNHVVPSVFVKEARGLIAELKEDGEHAAALSPSVIQWHYVTEKLPDDDTAILVACHSSGQPGEAVHENGVFLHAGSDIVIPDVYAWADLPEIPQPKGGA